MREGLLDLQLASQANATSVFLRLGHLLVGRALGLRRAPRPAPRQFCRSKELGWEPHADGASAPPKLSHLASRAVSGMLILNSLPPAPIST